MTELTLANGTATVRLSPAYIHRDAKGWRQDADILVEGASVESTQSEFPAGLADGRLKTAQVPYHNLCISGSCGGLVVARADMEPAHTVPIVTSGWQAAGTVSGIDV